MSTEKDIGHLRKSYEKGALDDALKNVSPISLFEQWFAEAEAHPAIEEANAMSLVTLGEDNFPKARVVLLKQFSPEGFVLYTNYNSEKGRALLAYPQVGLSFFWPALERQVIIKGKAEKVAAEVSDAYFSSRPLGSQLGAIASNQSEVIASREVLEKRLAHLETTYKDTTPKRPEHWGGILVRPEQIEFWQGRPNRLHDRLRYNLTSGSTWTAERLSP
ncbi:MAG: pyridoxamine 5'-phosphate oxidase [Flavobacteriaceae bacterium]